MSTTFCPLRLARFVSLLALGGSVSLSAPGGSVSLSTPGGSVPLPVAASVTVWGGPGGCWRGLSSEQHVSKAFPMPTLGPPGPTSNADSGSFKILMLVIMNFCIIFFFQTLYHNLTRLDY